MVSFSEKIAFSRSELIRLVKGHDQCKPCWYYVQIEKQKLELFRAKIKVGGINLTDYGIILYKGWGEEPPEDVKEKIKEQFG